VDEKPRKTEAELNRSRIDRCLAALEDAVKRSRTEDIRDDGVIYAALGFLERLADEKWPFEQFRRALDDFDANNDNELKAEGRAQVLNASLNGIRRAVKPSSTAH
jgi:hypothetical protein